MHTDTYSHTDKDTQTKTQRYMGMGGQEGGSQPRGRDQGAQVFMGRVIVCEEYFRDHHMEIRCELLSPCINIYIWRMPCQGCTIQICTAGAGALKSIFSSLCIGSLKQCDIDCVVQTIFGAMNGTFQQFSIGR